MINPIISIDRMKVIVKSFTGTIQSLSLAGLAEIETISRISVYQTTGIRNQNSIVSNYKLEQNYPNPFNPTTKIKFDLPHLYKGGLGGVLVSLKIYDITGREIKTLVNEYLNPGSYEVTFDGSNFASGVYLYQLRAGEFVVSKKMLLVK